MYYNNLSKNYLLNLNQEKNNLEKNFNFHCNINLIKSKYKNKNNIKEKFVFPSIFNNKKNNIKTPNHNKIEDNKIRSDKKNYQNYPNFNNDNINNIKKRKIFSYYFITKNGSHRGNKKINQDCYLFIPKINDIENIILFGVFNGHGPYGDKLSLEIKQYFHNFFTDNNIYKNNINSSINSVINEKNNNLILGSESLMLLNNNNSNKNSKSLFNHKKYSNIISKMNLYSNIINNKKNKKLEETHDILEKNNFLKIFESFNKIDKILHEKYTENKICDDTGTSLNFLIFFNSQNINKIISANLGNTKSILITDNKKIKELNIINLIL